MKKAKKANRTGVSVLPIRTCISCRCKTEKKKLARYILDKEGVLVFDAAKKLSGRGAYICFDIKCLSKALKKGFSQGLLAAKSK